VKEARSAVLEVPSVIVQFEPNYLINPGHPDFKRIKIGKPVPFAFDPRLA
jgi:RES domain-containing protein